MFPSQAWIQREFFMIKKLFRFVGLLFIGAVWVAAAKLQSGGNGPYNLVVPPGLPPPVIPADNPLTNDGVLLGNRLFNEKMLSGNDTQSCASCHEPSHAFSDEGVALSTGITGALGTRNAPALFNLVYQPSFFWDGRSPTLRAQCLAPIQNPVEMDSNLLDVVAKLDKNRSYYILFAKAFGSPGITSARIGLALEQYEETILCGYSKFDLVQQGKATFTAQEQQGFNVFRTPFNPRTISSAATARGATAVRCLATIDTGTTASTPTRRTPAERT